MSDASSGVAHLIFIDEIVVLLVAIAFESPCTVWHDAILLSLSLGQHTSDDLNSTAEERQSAGSEWQLGTVEHNQ